MKTINLVLSSLFLAGLALGTTGCPSSDESNGGTGGSGGGGGGGSTGAGCPTDATALISDFTTSTGIEPLDGRSGGWYFYGDSAGSWEPATTAGASIPPDMTMGACSPAGSLHMKGTDFSMWGAGMGTNFKDPVGGVKQPYDASKYTGILFRAKAAMSVSHMQVKFIDVNTDPEVASPKCMNLSNGNPENCSPYLVKDLTIPPDWKEFKIAFADAIQDPYNTGYVPTPDEAAKSMLTGVQIQINANYDASGTASPNNFDIWVDDVYFY